MSLLDRLKMGAILTKDSVLLIRHHPELGLFPIIGGVAGAFFLTLFLGLTLGLAAIDPQGGVLIGLLLAYFVLTFISTFFTAALVHETREVLAGREVSIRGGVAAAWKRKTPIVIWSLIAATVGVVINGLENSNSRAAGIFGVIFSFAWTVMTFFIIPVIMFERTSTVGMFKASGANFKRTYGETPISLIGIQLISFVVALPFFIIGFLVLSAGSAGFGIALILLGVLASFLVSQTLSGVVKTTLYFYAQEGKQPSEFSNIDFTSLNDKPRHQRSTTSGSFGGFQ